MRCSAGSASDDSLGRFRVQEYTYYDQMILCMCDIYMIYVYYTMLYACTSTSGKKKRQKPRTLWTEVLIIARTNYSNEIWLCYCSINRLNQTFVQWSLKSSYIVVKYLGKVTCSAILVSRQYWQVLRCTGIVHGGNNIYMVYVYTRYMKAQNLMLLVSAQTPSLQLGVLKVAQRVIQSMTVVKWSLPCSLLGFPASTACLKHVKHVKDWSIPSIWYC